MEKLDTKRPGNGEMPGGRSGSETQRSTKTKKGVVFRGGEGSVKGRVNGTLGMKEGT